MATQRNRVCDRCEFSEDETVLTVGWVIVSVGTKPIVTLVYTTRAGITSDLPAQFDLCPSCAGTFKHWIGQDITGDTL